MKTEGRNQVKARLLLTRSRWLEGDERGFKERLCMSYTSSPLMRLLKFEDCDIGMHFAHFKGFGIEVFFIKYAAVGVWTPRKSYLICRSSRRVETSKKVLYMQA